MDEQSQTDNKVKSSTLTVNDLLCYKDLVKILHVTSYVHSVVSETSIS